MPINTKETVEIEKSGLISTKIREAMDGVAGRIVGLLAWGTALTAGTLYAGGSLGDVQQAIQATSDVVGLIVSGNFEDATLAHGNKIIKPLALVGGSLISSQFIPTLLVLLAGYIVVSAPVKALVGWLFLGTRARGEHKNRIFISNVIKTLFGGNVTPSTPPTTRHSSLPRKR